MICRVRTLYFFEYIVKKQKKKKKKIDLSLCLPVDGPKGSELNDTVPGVYKHRDTHCITYSGSRTKARVKKYLPETGAAFKYI